MNKKTKLLIIIFLIFSILYLLDKFFDTYTFVSPIKKLEFQWVIQKRSQSPRRIPKNARVLPKKAGESVLAVGINTKKNIEVKIKPSIAPYPKYMTNEAFELRNKVLEYLNLSEEEKIAFDNIIKKESGYNPTSLNEIGAGGLCQAYPYTKMNCKLSWEDWRCQVDWCIQYIKNRYKNTVEAWKFHLVNNWF